MTVKNNGEEYYANALNFVFPAVVSTHVKFEHNRETAKLSLLNEKVSESQGYKSKNGVAARNVQGCARNCANTLLF